MRERDTRAVSPELVDKGIQINTVEEMAEDGALKHASGEGN